MKRITLILISILIIVFVVLSALGAGGEYAAEELFYHAMKAGSKIAANPDVVPPGLLAYVEKNLLQVIEKYKNTNMARTANIALAEFYTANKMYDKASSLISAIMNTYSQDLVIMSTAQFLKGAIYEKQKQWDKALAEFRSLRDKYPNTQLGIQIPIYIGRYYAVKGNEQEAENAYKDAVSFYEKIRGDNKGTVLGYTASVLLVQAYINLRNYDEAGRVLEETLAKYPASISFQQLLPTVEFVFVKKLNQPERAIEIYEGVIKNTRDAKLKNYLQGKISKFKKEK